MIGSAYLSYSVEGQPRKSLDNILGPISNMLPLLPLVTLQYSDHVKTVTCTLYRTVAQAPVATSTMDAITVGLSKLSVLRQTLVYM